MAFVYIVLTESIRFRKIVIEERLLVFDFLLSSLSKSNILYKDMYPI